MGRHKKVLDPQAVFASYLVTRSKAKTAMAFNTSIDVVARTLKDHGVQNHQRSYVTEDVLKRWREIKAACDEHKSYRKVGDLFGMSRQRVQQVLKKLEAYEKCH